MIVKIHWFNILSGSVDTTEFEVFIDSFLPLEVTIPFVWRQVDAVGCCTSHTHGSWVEEPFVKNTPLYFTNPQPTVDWIVRWTCAGCLNTVDVLFPNLVCKHGKSALDKCEERGCWGFKSRIPVKNACVVVPKEKTHIAGFDIFKLLEEVCPLPVDSSTSSSRGKGVYNSETLCTTCLFSAPGPSRS